MQAKIDPLVFELNFAAEGVEAEKERLSRVLFKRELGNIWTPVPASMPFAEIVRTSLAKRKMAFNSYASHNVPGLFILAASLLVSVVFRRSLRSRYNEQLALGGPAGSNRAG